MRDHSVRNPASRSFFDVIHQVRAEVTAGEVADYIPELGKANPDRFGIAATSVTGRSYAAGDSADRFTMQSISKAFVYALALGERGVDEVLDHVGVEPSGETFNAISFDELGRPDNPMVNAGALVTTSLIRASSAEERFEKIRQGLSAFAGRELEPDDSVYESESEHGDRNRALASLAKSTGKLGSSVDEAAEPYFRQCALLVDSTDLSIMAATLANDGVNPVTSQVVVSEDITRYTLSLMASCGMYDRSGQWLFEVGMPAKSGVGGGIVAVAPGEFGIGVFSPPLDEAGNSTRGVAALRVLSEEHGLHLFRHLDRPVSPVTRIQMDPRSRTVRVVLRGVIDFVAGEMLLHETLKIAGTEEAEESGTIIFDLEAVTSVAEVATTLIRDLDIEVRRNGWTIEVYDPSGVLEA